MSYLNKTHAEHALIAVVIQLLMWPVFGVVAGGAIAVAVFLGREISQHETSGGGANAVSWHYGLTNHWTTDSILDVASPLAACLLVAAAVIVLL